MSATLIDEPENPFKQHFKLLFRNPEHQQQAYSEFMEYVRENGVNQNVLDRIEKTTIGE